MASKLGLLVQLLLVSLVSASHYFGGTTTFTYKETYPDGSHRVDIRRRNTFDGCQYSLWWSCFNGNCGSNTRSQRGVLDQSTNAPISNRRWCETETVVSKRVYNDKPFEERAASCCWIWARNGVGNWRLRTHMDLGTRSDTRKPNRSPDIAILPFLRVPQNCPRTYNLMSFDPDNDQVRCRYGTAFNTECSRCDQPSGFHLDQDSCTLHYYNASADPRIFGFELVVEDFPQNHITLAYSDGTRSSRAPLALRRGKRQAFYTTPYPTTAWWWWRTATTPSTSTRSAPWWWRTTTTTPSTSTRSAPWWWWRTTTTTPSTSTRSTPWWWSRTTTSPPWWRRTTTTSPPWWRRTTTTSPPWWRRTTTTSPPWWRRTTTTSPPWWWRTTTTRTPSTPTHSSTTAPLSKLPLQFSLLVDPPAPSCQEGLYLPKFVHPTPENGAIILAETNKEVEIRVKAHAHYATLHDIIISGPLNVTKHRNTRDDFVIRWTPLSDDLGDFFPICFAVEAVTASATSTGHTTPNHHHFHPTPSAQSGIYQSEMRCVLVNVRRKQVNAHVVCTESTMTVHVDKSSLRGLHEDHLRLSDPLNTACSLETHSNSTHIIAVIPLNACGTQIEEDDDYLRFKNEITTVDNSADLITRKHQLEVQFYCQYPKRGNVTLGFTAHRNNVTVSEKGYGTFTYEFEFYPDNQYRSRIDPSAYPLEYDVGSRIYMQIEATSSLNNTELFIDSCRASPYDNTNYQPTYPIIENGCTVDPTVEIYHPQHNKQFRFSMEAFKFIGLHDQVYITCSVLMCEAGYPSSRCSQGCINSTWPSGHHHHHRRKREAVIQSGNHFISQGPLRLRRSAEGFQVTNLNLNLNMVFIAGCLLAAVGMICGVVLYKSKMSQPKYQPLPTLES
ncbi:uncharacterized protein LOC115040881 isoform X3 [Echeneis naucrates]|uniref:uncharacterized protein LOC115040881 isoform X3 n=1 Tax=Echeneis naucrates TaxID=173247 RepID=UPI00111331D1|nr:uncharacterized protein LOC115040881 isoform X3 [Echeneis naucrates]